MNKMNRSRDRYDSRENRYYSPQYGNVPPEQEDDLSVDEIIQKTKSKRNETLEVTRDALKRLQTTEQSGMATMEKLNTQSDILRKAKTSMDVAKAHQEVANEQVSELKKYSKLIPWGNPFKRSNASKKLRDAKTKQQYEESMRESDELRRSQRDSERRTAEVKNSANRDPSAGRGRSGQRKQHSDLLDEDDRHAEDEIDSNLDQISSIAQQLKGMAMNMNDEIKSQSKLVDHLTKNADDVNVSVKLTQNRMKRWN
jgi:hypothetical protein